VDYADVSGRVLLHGKPLPGGTLVFVTTDGFSGDGRIDEKGNYKGHAPIGEVKIGVDNRMLDKTSKGANLEAVKRGAGRPDSGQPDPVKGTYVRIDSKYYDPTTSGLTYTVTKDPQTHDITLE
jgi:hypothetical protein